MYALEKRLQSKKIVYRLNRIMKMLVACVLLLWPLAELGVCILKDGTCPPGQRRACILGGPDDVPGCESDADCKGRQKCCPGVCRPICQDPVEDPCRGIVCDLPVCPAGWALSNDGCCPSCIDCRLVRCAYPICPEGSEVVDPEEGCCPVCSEIVKDGTCPPGQRRACILGGPDDVPGCESDADCKGRQKCCPGVCRPICQDPVEDPLCPDGSNPVNCFVRPCRFATCEAYPDATCEDNYCGGCIADWYVNGELVDCNVCQLPLVTGPCEALFPRWGFRDDECVEFTYGGCEGNDNNFKSLADCIDECGPN